jgi:hypothetical protein
MDLTQFDNAYEQASAEGARADLPEGDYDMTFVDFTFKTSKEDRPLLFLNFQVNDGECKGVCISKIFQLDNPERFGFLKKDMVTMGVMVQKVSQLPEALEKTKGIGLRVHAKQNGKYTNYYINGRSIPKVANDDTTPF